MCIHKRITSHKREGGWAWSFQIVTFRLARVTVIQRWHLWWTVTGISNWFLAHRQIIGQKVMTSLWSASLGFIELREPVIENGYFRIQWDKSREYLRLQDCTNRFATKQELARRVLRQKKFKSCKHLKLKCTELYIKKKTKPKILPFSWHNSFSNENNRRQGSIVWMDCIFYFKQI